MLLKEMLVPALLQPTEMPQNKNAISNFLIRHIIHIKKAKLEIIFSEFQLAPNSIQEAHKMRCTNFGTMFYLKVMMLDGPLVRNKLLRGPL